MPPLPERLAPEDSRGAYGAALVPVGAGRRGEGRAGKREKGLQPDAYRVGVERGDDGHQEERGAARQSGRGMPDKRTAPTKQILPEYPPHKAQKQRRER